MANGTSPEKDKASQKTSRLRIPLRITDTTLRDAHQSLWATRMTTKDILGIIDIIDSAGYYSLEVWGGATFDVCLRFLRENPWERLRQIKARAKKTPLQMLLRGQNILGYKNYPDDLLDRFIALACENGMDIFRIFDALNDNRNMEHAIKSVKRYGGHVQGTLCYTVSPVHTVKQYVRIAKEQVALGIDSLCLKDMAGILSPISSEKLISALVREVAVPIQMHCHATSGMATATYVEGVRAGAGAIDCAISSMSGFSSQPPVETMLSIFKETSYHADLDLEALRKICDYFIKLTPERQLSQHPGNIIDPEILVHHIPGGMISNLRSQLQQQNALGRLNEVLEELPRVRADLGYPPLVTPTSQIIGIQAVMNVLSGERYSMVPQETKNYVKGLYGRAPAPINAAVKRKILGKEKTITCRPADLLEPILPQATSDIDPAFIKSEEDIISYCLFPEPALEYFKWRNLPPEEKPPLPVDLEKTQKTAAPEESIPSPTTKPFLAPQDYEKLRVVIEQISQLGLSEVIIRKGEQNLSLEPSRTGIKKTGRKSVRDKSAQVKQTKSGEETAAPPPEKIPEGPTIDAPLNGTFYTTSGPGKPNLVKEGDIVKAGQPVCIVEAMKLFNQINVPSDCKIVKIIAKHGQAVEKGQPLMVIEIIKGP